MEWAEALIGASFGGRSTRGCAPIDALACPGIVAELDGQPAGLLTYRQDSDQVEIAYLEVTVTQSGVGTRLVEAGAE